ncbi:LysR family transcriptional regulator [Thioclava sp. JM3]|uniref:LysR family transcriptional regulator n=1 Tax=Thioclava sp. JM3 TaxID=1973004 RepID=UPI000B538DA4|nr:LysR substrate-binding domain-containing protein [Thioclava sp. JM3]OWY14255.1 LysR family transcriptional regulator [Thioclava sp. JM3]
MNLTVRQLQTFREVMRSGSISEAARNLGRTQPAVSSMIAGLEDELGFSLFDRGPGRFLPTPEALFFAEEAEAILLRIDRTRANLRSLSAHNHGRLKIASHPAASGIFVPRILGEFLRGKPDVEATVMMRSSAVIEDLVASQQFDVGFAETPEPRNSIRQEDFELEHLCAVPENDPLAEADEITPKDLHGLPMATLFDEHPSFVQTSAAFASQNCALKRRFELQTFLPGLTLVASGLCYMICDMITADSYLHAPPTGPKVVFRRFRPRIASGISILTPAHRPVSLLTTEFCRQLLEEVRRLENRMAESL